MNKYTVYLKGLHLHMEQLLFFLLFFFTATTYSLKASHMSPFHNVYSDPGGAACENANVRIRLTGH